MHDSDIFLSRFSLPLYKITMSTKKKDMGEMQDGSRTTYV